MVVNPYMLSPYREINAQNKSPREACINAIFPLMNGCMLLKKSCSYWKILKMASTGHLTFSETIPTNKIHKMKNQTNNNNNSLHNPAA